MSYSYPRAYWTLRTALLLFPPVTALGQAPIITSIIPMANARAAARTSPLTVNFSQPLTAASAGALKVFSSQRGGLRSRGATPAVVNGNTLSFAPTAYPYMPGETVQYTVVPTMAPGGGSPGRVGRFTTAVGGTGGGNFTIGSDPVLGNGPDNVALGDIDGDGDLDMLAATSDNNAVTVLLNNGRGTFGTQTSVPVGSYPLAVVCADVDGDGDLDLLVANKRDQTVSIRLNDGLGKFSGSQNVGVGSDPHGLAVGDADGDGDLDLFTANVFANTVSVRFNDGNGVFSGNYNVGVGPTPQRVTLGDVDNDGDLDLLTANFNNLGTVSIRFNDGNGSFSSVGQEVGVGTYPYGVAVGDMDNDGDLDLVTFSFVPNGLISIRFNDSSGFFAGTRDISAGSFTSCMALGDVNGDENLDVLVATSYGTLELVAYLNDGMGWLNSTQGIAVGLSPYSIAVGDIDNDGDLDALVANWTSVAGSLSVRLNGGTGPLAATAGHNTGPALALFPNPTHGAVTLTGAMPGASVAVLDAVGRVRLTATTNAAGTARLPLDGLPAGVYLLRSGAQVRQLTVE